MQGILQIAIKQTVTQSDLLAFPSIKSARGARVKAVDVRNTINHYRLPTALARIHALHSRRRIYRQTTPARAHPPYRLVSAFPVPSFSLFLSLCATLSHPHIHTYTQTRKLALCSCGKNSAVLEERKISLSLPLAF